MPGQVLHVGAVAQCPHGGTVQFTSADPRVTVSGQPVVTAPATFPIAGCVFPPPPVADGPCTSATWVSVALRVRAQGSPLVLADAPALCAPTGVPVTVVVAQTRVSAR